MWEGKCIQCESDQHIIADCDEYKKIQSENKKRIEAQGKRWYSWEERKAMQQAKFKAKNVRITTKFSNEKPINNFQSSTGQSD